MWKKTSVALSITGMLLVGAQIASAQINPTPTRQNNSTQPPAATQLQQNGQQSPAQNAPQNGQPNAPVNAQNQQNERAYLGVSFDAVPRAIASQLSTNFPQLANGSGVLITHVTPDSPAAKSGLKPYDLVTEVNNRPISSADELMNLVGGQRPGQQLSLQIVRSAKAENLNVTLGERPAVVRGQEPEPQNTQASENGQEGNDEASVRNVEVELESFDALSIERTGKDQFKAEIKFRDNQGKIDARTFQGTRAEIRKDILAQRDLPRSERRQLLGSLRLPMELFPASAPRQNGAQENAPQGNNPQGK